MASFYVEVNKTQEDVPGVGAVTAASPLSSSGGTTPEISINYTPVDKAGDTMTGPLDATVVYDPANSAKWSGDPTSIAEAIDRIAAVVGNSVPIP